MTGTFLLALASAVYTGWASHTENHILDSAKMASYIPWGAEESYPNPLIRSIGNYSLADLHRQYKKYIHKRPKHILL